MAEDTIKKVNQVEFTTSLNEIRLVDIELHGYKNWFEWLIIGKPSLNDINENDISDVKVSWGNENIDYRIKNRTNISDQSYLQIGWQDICDVHTTDHYIFLGDGKQGFYVPKHAFEDNGKYYLDQIRKYCPELEFEND